MNENAFYIEVVSEAEYTENIEKYVLDLELQVTATKDDTALNEIAQLKERCVKHLLQFGVKPSEVFDGGTSLTRPWYRKKVGKEALVKIILQVDDLDRLSHALNSIEQVKSGQREVIQMRMRSPLFTADETQVAQALQIAVRKAKEKAAILATEADIELAGISRIEELSKAKRDSGAYGDEDWSGDYMRFSAAPSGGSMGEADCQSLDLESPQRIVWVRYKVRFLVKLS